MPVLIYIWNISTCLCWERKPFNTPILWVWFQERYIVILPRTCLCLFIFEILAHAYAGKENHLIHWLTESDFKRYIFILPRTYWCWFIFEILAHACAGKENHKYTNCLSLTINLQLHEMYIVILPRTCWCWFIFEILAHACAGKEKHMIHCLSESYY